MKSPQLAALVAFSLMLTPAALAAYSPAPRSTSGEENTHIDISLNRQIYPPAIPIPGITLPKEFNVFCVGCTAVGDVSMSGGGKNLGAEFDPDSNFTATGFDFTQNWVGLAFDDFEMHLEFAVDLKPEAPGNELVVHLLESPRTFPALSLGKFISGVATFDPQIHGWINTSAAVNFTYGFDLKVPSSSVILIPVANPKNAMAVGFDETTITPTSFESAGGLNVTLELSFRPIFQLKFTVFGEVINVEASADLPKLDVDISQVFHVDSACNPGNSSSKTYNDMTHVVPSLSFDVDVDVNGKDFVPLSKSIGSLPTGCFQFNQKGEVTGTPGPALNGGNSTGNSSRNGSNSGITKSAASVLSVPGLLGLVLAVFVVFL